MANFFLILFSLSSLFAKTDIKGLSDSDNQQLVDKKIEAAKPLKTKKESAQIKSEGNQDVEKLRESLKGINLVLNSQPNSPNRVELLLKKAFLHVTIVREMGRNRKSSTQLTEEEKKHLTTAKEILNKMLQPSVKIDNKKKHSIYYLLGLAAYEYEDYKLQQKYFIEALNIDPKGPQAGSLALMIAEQYFDEDDFANALKYYNGYLKVMTDQQKDLALYKSAWCYISTQQMDKAEIELLRVILANHKNGFQKDSIRDLAFIAVKHRDENGIILFGQQRLKNEDDRNEFYSLCLKYFYQIQTKQSLNRLIALVLKGEKKVEVRLEIIGHQINGFRVDYLNPQLLSYYQAVRLELEKSKTSIDAAELDVFRKTFQNDMEFFIYHITQVYQLKSGDAQAANKTIDVSKEPQAVKDIQATMSKAKVAALLEKNIIYYDMFFPESKNKIIIYQVWSDLCVDSKVIACVTQVIQKAKNYKPTDKVWNDFRLKVRSDQLAMADEMYTKDPSKNESLLLQIFTDFKKDYPGHELVVKGLKKMIQIYSSKSNAAEVEKNYAELYQNEKNPENLYNWCYILFKQEKYADVVNILKDEFANDTKLNQLRSESHLKLAEKDTISGDFKSYESHIVEILKMSTDENKTALIYSDWLQKCLNLKEGGVDRAAIVFDRIPQKIKSKPMFDAFLVKFAAAFVNFGDFDKLNKLNLNSLSKNTNVGITYFKLINYFTNSDIHYPNWIKDLQTLDADKRSYLIGTLVLFKPEQALEYLKKAKVKESNLPDLYFLALKLVHQSEKFDISPLDSKIIGENAKSLKKVETKTPPILAEITKIKFPTSKMSFQKYNAAVEKLVPLVKSTREKISKSFQKATLEQQILIAPEAEKLETNTALAIQSAPLPPGLEESQKVEYQNGINDLAKEFIDQAAEYKKMFDGLSAKKSEIEKQILSDKLPEIDLNNWPFPKGDVFKKALSLQTQSSMQANLYLDSQLAEKAINENDYLVTHVGLLALSQNSEVMRNYIKQELVTQKKEDLIEKWKSLAPQPVASPVIKTDESSKKEKSEEK